jgi:hypothetical protein
MSGTPEIYGVDGADCAGQFRQMAREASALEIAEVDPERRASFLALKIRLGMLANELEQALEAQAR